MCRSLVRLVFLVLSSFLYFYSEAQVIDSVIIGNGGGFTGQVTTYKISGKKIWKAEGKSSPSYSQEAKLSCKARKKVKKEGRALLDESPFDHPGNTYKWVALFFEGKSYRFVWGDPQFTPPTSLVSYYQFINQLVPTLIFK